jgi:hypothetical protein
VRLLLLPVLFLVLAVLLLVVLLQATRSCCA